MSVITVGAEVAIERLEVSAYEIPTDMPESDGTLEWDSTTIVIVEVEGGGSSGLGYTYSDRAAATLIESKLRKVVERRDALSVPAAWARMQHAVRNIGRPGVSSAAIAAVDCA